ncbi:alpha-actinin-1-like [Orbicella faveolata]|uniref:alpha-actinin-1-like n=1 Tax=Orbicella faveolata TaxID=48498 RepID=UPI0009E63872|nr:alpha-actinin-1-like [Orbicella faveolata]XP_020615407.1 alpha-actinin-1-like [Orbicella faveolata]
MGNDNRTNLDHAFNVANKEFSVPRLLDPEDIDVDKPDKKSIIMYLTSLYHGLREYSPQGGRNGRKLYGTGVNLRLDQLDEKDAKFATFQEKRNALVLILRNCLEKLENLRAKGAANDMREVNEQQNIVKVKTSARTSRYLRYNS